jgi:hypothetical protein
MKHEISGFTIHVSFDEKKIDPQIIYGIMNRDFKELFCGILYLQNVKIEIIEGENAKNKNKK